MTAEGEKTVVTAGAVYGWLVLSILLSTLALERPTYASDGFAVSDESAHVHVLMPSRAQMQVNQTRDTKSKSGGYRREQLWKVIWNDGLWAVSSTVIPRDVAHSTLPTIARNIIKASDAVEVDRQSVLLDGVQGLEFLFKDTRFISRWRIFLLDAQTLVDIRYVGKPGTENRKDVESYFASFALRGSPKIPPGTTLTSPTASNVDLIDQLKGKTIKITGLLATTEIRKQGDKPFLDKDEHWPLTLKLRQDGLISWNYSDPICPVDGKFRDVEILFGTRDGETSIIPEYRKEQVRCAGDVAGRWGLSTSTLQGVYKTVRLVSDKVLTLTQEFSGSAEKTINGGQGNAATAVNYHTEFSVGISFGNSNCEVVRVDWRSGSTEKDPAEPSRSTETSRKVEIASKTYCIIR